MIRPRRLLAAALLLAALPSAALSDPAGFAFLEIPAGARASALGGAYASVASGVEAVFWNPAGLEGAKGVQITAAHFEHLDMLRVDQFAVAGRMFGGGMAASVRALYSEPIEERDAIGNLVGTFGAHDLEFALGYGRALGERLEAGASLQLVRERIADVAATTYAVNLGVAYRPAWLEGARLAAAASNLGPDARFSQDGAKGDPVPLPMAVQAGLSYTLPGLQGFPLRGSLEGRFTRGRSGVAMAGAELETPVGAAVRAGLRLNDEATSFSAGAGWGTGALRLDYAWVPYRLDLGDTHRFGLSLQF